MISDVNNFDLSIIDNTPDIKRKRGNPHGKKQIYKDIITAFDIETTTLLEEEQSFMYIWQMQIGLDYTIIGRSWKEFFEFLKQIKKHLKGSWLVIYVHNLSFEFQFLKGWYNFEPDEVFCTDNRKILKCTMFDSIEFRCSYLLTNMSLAQFTYQMKIENKKLSGELFDYNKVRYPDTPLTDYELQYCINDVQGLVQALYKSFSIEGDNVQTVPLTSTGYVRRDAKKAMEQYNHDQLADMLPDLQVYTLLREAFRGGNTHANRWFTGDIIPNVKSIDRVSSYPDVMINCKFPMSKFYEVPSCTFNELKRLIYDHKKPVLMRIAFYDLKLRDILQGAPYLSRDKCRDTIGGVYDNGRILKADYLETTITDIDFKIILSMYDWSACDLIDVFASVYKPLPQMLKDVVLKYYVDKTVLKGNEEMEVYYTKSKNKLNSCYG